MTKSETPMTWVLPHLNIAMKFSQLEGEGCRGGRLYGRQTPSFQVFPLSQAPLHDDEGRGDEMDRTHSS